MATDDHEPTATMSVGASCEGEHSDECSDESSNESSNSDEEYNHDSDNDRDEKSDNSDNLYEQVPCMRFGDLLVITGTNVVVDEEKPKILGIMVREDNQLKLVVPRYPTAEMRRCAEENGYDLPYADILTELDELENTIESVMRDLMGEVRDLKRMIRLSSKKIEPDE